MDALNRNAAPGGSGRSNNTNNADNITENLLSKLDKVRQTGPGRWIALCPAHDDKHPSLSVTETEDGTILIKCWAGCGASEVIAAIGLEFSDLFPNKGGYKSSKRGRQPFNPKDILKILAHESLIVLLVANDLVSGKVISDVDMQRLKVAQEKLANASEVARGNY